jgi:hypothetical protein
VFASAIIEKGRLNITYSQRSKLMLSSRAHAGLPAFTGVVLFAGLIGCVVSLPCRTAADTPQITGHLTAASNDEPTGLEVPALVDVHEFQCGQLPGVGSVSPFPLHLRLGGMLSPVTKLAVGADVTITGLHLLPSFNTRVDGDVIFGGNLGGSRTFFPVTVDELYHKSLPGGTSIYFGPGVGMYFGGKTRFGGKLALGASVNRIGIEANVDFAGIGDPLFLLQARVGL